MACDLWLVPLVDVLCHTPDNPFAEELALYNRLLGEAGLPPVPVYQYMPGLTGEVAPVVGFDYDALHFLRRAYLLQVCGLEVTPVDALGGDYEQLLEMFEGTAQQSHLVWHYDHMRRLRPGRLPAAPVQRRTPRRRRPSGLCPGPAEGTGVRGPGHRHRPGEPSDTARSAARAHGVGGTRRPGALRPQPVRSRTARLAGPARGGDPKSGAGIDDRLQLRLCGGRLSGGRLSGGRLSDPVPPGPSADPRGS